MNTTDDNTPDDTGDEGPSRIPLGAWLRLVDALITRELASALDPDDLSRRDWMLLNAISGATDAPWIAERLAHGAKHVRRLAERGWIARDDSGDWTLTDDGHAAQKRLGEKVAAVRARVAGAVSDDEFAQLLTSLKAIARELGWDESQPMPRRGRGLGRSRSLHDRREDWGHGHDAGWGAHHEHMGFGPAHPHPHDEGFGPHAQGFGPAHRRGHSIGHECAHTEVERSHHGAAHAHGAHGHGVHRRRRAERAYERGFAAGFAAARPAGGPDSPSNGTGSV